MDIPANCAMCDSICPTNFGTTITEGVQALSIDVGNAVRLIDKCFAGGFAGCVCNVMLALKPAWIDFLPTPQERCSGGNIFGLLANKILEMTLQSAEDALNIYIVRPTNAIIRTLFKSISFGFSSGPKLPNICLTGFWKPGGQCFDGDASFFEHFGCYNTDRARADDQCYFFRQRAICGMEGGQNRYGRYQDLFSAPSGDELDKTYQKIAGDSYRTMNPTLAALVRSVDSATLSADAEAAKNVCDDSITESMDLDEVRLLDLNSQYPRSTPPHRLPRRRLLFHVCSTTSRASARRATRRRASRPFSSRSIGAFRRYSGIGKRRKLCHPKRLCTHTPHPCVRLESSRYRVLVRRPPPPPGLLKRGPLARIAVYDPEGFALAEQALDDFFPSLEYVASKSTGSRIRNKYGPKYFVNKYELSMAFMAAENFEVHADPSRVRSLV